MRNGSKQLRRGSAVIIETLEARELMSAAPVHAAAAVTHVSAATIHAQAVAKAAAAKAAAAEKAAAAKATAAAKVAAVKAAATKAAVVKAVAPTITAPISALHQTPAKSTTPNLVGTWTGTIQYDGDITATPFSINFQFQLEASASGTFNLGPAIGNQSPQSTMVITNHNEVRALILNNTLWVGFTGLLEPSGNQMIGRFAYNSPTGWKTGSFNITRN
jgi:hypothetical protein